LDHHKSSWIIHERFPQLAHLLKGGIVLLATASSALRRVIGAAVQPQHAEPDVADAGDRRGGRESLGTFTAQSAAGGRQSEGDDPRPELMVDNIKYAEWMNKYEPQVDSRLWKPKTMHYDLESVRHSLKKIGYLK
jgi:hypothetical protein